MIDAAQARVVAYTTGDGEILCAGHAEEQYGTDIRTYVDEHGITEDNGTSFDLWEAFEAAGLTAISRYEIDANNSENLHHLEATELVEWLGEADRLCDFAAEIVEASSDGAEAFKFQAIVEEAWDDSMLGMERCDNDSEII
jgi:hypothetical protein